MAGQAYIKFQTKLNSDCNPNSQNLPKKVKKRTDFH
jgi:hypothetical protein